MASNLEKYKKDLENLINSGNRLMVSMQFECDPVEYERQYKNAWGKDYETYRKNFLCLTANISCGILKH
jgi:hypothetical protein